MTEVKSFQSLYFSPTGTTRKILNTIEENTGLTTTPQIDLTSPKVRDTFTGETRGDILLVGSPVHYGSTPWPMLKPLNRLDGKGRWAVPVAVYGNRSAETCVEEMAKILRSRGFKILAAASFSAEHSYSSEFYWIAKGRPDGGDLQIAARFGGQIREKLLSGPSEIQTSDKLFNYLTKEMVTLYPEGYHKELAEGIKKIVGFEFSDDATCSMCMSCDKVCPTDALDISSRKMDDDLCISCNACSRVCPEGVIRCFWRGEKTPGFVERLETVFGTRREPQIFI